MADDLTVAVAGGTAVLRAKEVGGKLLPHQLVGEHVRVYDGVQNLVLSSAAQSLTVPGGATHALIYAEGASASDFARYWHGTAPTASVGKKLKDHEEIASAAPASFQAINGSGTVTLRVEFYHYA